MTARSYALILIAGAATLFLALAATNLVLDPWWVFRVSPLPHSAININDRYDSYRRYTAAPDHFDAALLASSRGLAFSLDDLSRYTNDSKYARFSVSIGRLADHAAVLDFLVRDKAARGERLRQVFLLIDIDDFGEPPPYADDLQLLQPSAISGEPAFHFWWRNLTVVQFVAWRRVVDDVRSRRAQGHVTLPAAIAAQLPSAAFSGVPLIAIADSKVAAERVSERPRFADDMRSWKRIVALCRDHNIRLITALSPMFPGTLARLDSADVAGVAAQISRLAPVWDFSGPHEPSNRSDLWWSPRHYHDDVARMMLARIFGADVPREWSNFGQSRRPGDQPAR